MALMDWIKSNPGKSAAIVGAVVVVAYFASSGGTPQSSGAVAPVDDVTSGTAMQILSAQLSDRASQRSFEAAQAEGEWSVQKYLADLSSTLSMASINAQQQTRALEITSYTQSQNYMAELAAETAESKMSYDYQTDKLMADYMTTASNNQLEQQKAFISGQVQIAKINKPKQGLFSRIFG